MEQWEIPEKVRRTAALRGQVGYAWLAELPQQIAEIERQWAIKVGQPVRRGSEAFVAEARTDRGLDAIVKLVIPGIDPMRHELRVLRTAEGRSYARLIRSDEDNYAMLLEKLGVPLFELDLPEEQQVQAICATLDEAWRLPPEGPPLPTGAGKATELSRTIEAHWNALGRPCLERTIEKTLSYSERRRRAFDPAQSVLVHGDAHQWNTLMSPGTVTGFKFVDPDGGFAERAFDLAILMREWGSVMPAGDVMQLVRRRCSLLAKFSDVDPQAIWEWGLIQCVWNGFSLLQIGLHQPASVSLTMADAWSTAGHFAAA